MTEAEWLACTEPKSMLVHLREKTSQSKFHLFAIACCRRIWHLLDGPSRHGIEIAELYFEGKGPRNDLLRAKISRTPLVWDNGWYAATYTAENTAGTASRDAFDRVARTFVDALGTPPELAQAKASAHSAWLSEREAQAALLRDVIF